MIVEADGGARGNPGPAGYGALVRDAGQRGGAGRAAGSLGVATNNVAEYSGLIAGLTAAAELGAREVEVRMDSKLVVEQMSGRWQIKHPALRPLAAQAASAGRPVRHGALHLDPPGAQPATPTRWPTRRWTPPPEWHDRAAPVPARLVGAAEYHADPADPGAPRGDRADRAAALLGPG